MKFFQTRKMKGAYVRYWAGNGSPDFLAALFSFSAIVFLSLALSSCHLFSSGGAEETSKKEKSSDLISLHSGELLVGHVGALSGQEASFGTSIRNGIQMALDQANESDGVHGKYLKMISMDDQGDVEKAGEATEKLIEEKNTIAILGAAASSRSIAMAKVAQEKKTPMISPSSTNPKVTEVGNYIFRVCFIDPFQGPVMARFVYNHLNARKVAIIRDIKSDYSLGLATYFKQKFVELGGKIITDQSYNANDVDFKAQLTAVKEAKPDLVYVPGYYADVAKIIVQAREMGIDVPFAGGDGWESSELFRIGGKALNGSYFSSHYSPSAKDKVMRKFVKAYRKRFDEIPDALAALGYDAANVLIQALKSTKGKGGKRLRNAIAKTKGFTGATGKITIDSKRNAVKSAVIFEIQDGQPKYVRTIAP